MKFIDGYNAFVSWVNAHDGRWPQPNPEDKAERVLRSWMCSQRFAIHSPNRTNVVMTPENLKLLQEIPNWVTPVSLYSEGGKAALGERARKWMARFNKPVESIAKDGTVTPYPGIRAASRVTGVSSNSISDCCTGRKKTAGGLQWRFVEEATGGDA